jgi:starch synthase
MIASECEPWAKSGGLGDVVDALARALPRVARAPGGAAVEGPVDVFLPRYASIRVPADGVGTRVVRVPDPRSPDGSTDVTILSLDADGYRLRLVDLPAAFDRDGFYGTGGADHPDNAWRFGMHCRAALETLLVEGRPIDVVHVHDWQGAPAVLYRDAWYWGDYTLGRTAFVLTVHNPAYHGWTNAPDVPSIGLPNGFGDAYGLDLLRTAIERAELVNTVSPGFAREVLTTEYGKGLEWALGGRGDRFIGIINGIDTEAWDPATDAVLPATFDAGDLSGKAACRAALLAELGFDPADDGALLGVVGRLDPQKGFDLIAGAADRLTDAGARLVALGTGDPDLVAGLRALAVASPDRIAVREEFDRDLARRIYAGSDLFLMPSRFEPCGQSQMIAMRYGTPPIVRRTGGLADTVVDADEAPGAGTGFAFDEPTADALLAATRRAMRLRSSADRRGWDGVVARGMARDWSWESGPAREYVDAYERAMSFRR